MLYVLHDFFFASGMDIIFSSIHMYKLYSSLYHLVHLKLEGGKNMGKARLLKDIGDQPRLIYY